MILTYFSFDFNFNCLIIMNLMCFHMTAAQYKWLERDLASVDRKVTPWLVATWHAPWYSTYTAHYREVECMRVEMEELLYNYGVDIVLNGHVSKFCSSFIFSICTGMTGCTLSLSYFIR